LFNYDEVLKDRSPKTYNFNILVKDPNMKVELLDFKCILIIIYNYLKFLTIVLC